MPRRRPEFVPGEAGAEAAKLKKFSDAGGTHNSVAARRRPGAPKDASSLGNGRGQKPILEVVCV
jgi:hypothetical protein